VTPRRPCLEADCRRLSVPGKPRCPAHQQQRQQASDAKYRDAKAARRPQRRSYAAIKANAQLVAAWRAAHGDWCPGLPELHIAPHPAIDLTAQHGTAVAFGGDELAPTGVLCRPCNSSDGAMVRKRMDK
jgi:hypothetical protein